MVAPCGPEEEVECPTQVATMPSPPGGGGRGRGADLDALRANGGRWHVIFHLSRSRKPAIGDLSRIEEGFPVEVVGQRQCHRDDFLMEPQHRCRPNAQRTAAAAKGGHAHKRRRCARDRARGAEGRRRPPGDGRHAPVGLLEPGRRGSPGARFVDLFAGSGAYGLEAFSRGASGGTFVERNAKAIGCLRKNIAAVCRSLGKGGGELVAAEADALSLPTGTGALPDLIFVDPPYEAIGEVAPVLFAKLSSALPPDWAGLVVFEMPGEVTLEPVGWTCVKRLGRGARQPSVAVFARLKAD